MRVDFEVRDYECDVQGIVNNAVYLQYLEHARHKFLLSKGIDFIKLSKQNKDLVVREAQYKYHKSLLPDDKFHIETKVKLEGKTQLVFEQEIYRGDEKILSGKITGACVDFKANKIFKILDIVGPNLLEN
jgi:acyl-CoA thioester hydrolase